MCLGIVAAALVGGLPGAGDATPPEVVVQRLDFTKHLIFSGELLAAESVNITTPNIASTWSFTITYLAPEGDGVQAGDLLAEFDSASLQIKRLELEKKVEDARIKIAQKAAEIEGRRQDLLLNQATAEKTLRVTQLYVGLDAQLVTRADAEKYEFEHAKAKLELEKVNERLANLEKSAQAELAVVRLEYEQAELELRRVRSELERMSIRAPMPGLVIYPDNWESGRKVQKGDGVFRGQPVVLLPNMNRVKVAAFVHDVDFTALREGMPAEVMLDALPGRVFRGEVAVLPQAASQRTSQSLLKTFRVEILLLEKDLGVMKPGMTARVRVPVVQKNVLVAPRNAVQVDARGRTFVLRPGSAPARVGVNIRDANDRFAWIEPEATGSLKDGERILASPPASRSRALGQIEWIPVKKDSLTFTVPGTGMVAAAKAADIRPPPLTDYRNFKIVRMVEEGKVVQPGEFLLEFDGSEIQKRLRDEQANYQRAQQEYEKTQASLELNVKDLELQLEEARVQREKADSKLAQYREFEGFLKVKEAEFEALLARKRVEMLEKKLDSVRTTTQLQLRILKDGARFYQRRIDAGRQALEALVITAPIAGVVIYQSNWNNEKKQVGSNVWMMETVLAIPDLTTLRVDGQVAEVDAGKVRRGQKVAVTLDAVPEETFSGTVVETSSVFKQASFDRPIKVFEIKVKLDKIDPRRMRPGMAARLQAISDSFEDVLAVPLSALQVENGKSYVWVKEKQQPVQRAVKVGKNNGMVAIIESGLRGGEEIASRPPL